MDDAAFDFLLTPAGHDLLSTAEASYDEANTLALSTRLRVDYAAELVAAALTQIALRRRATAKFGADATRMFFTADGLEQATHPHVAAHRAARLSRQQDLHKGSTVLDLGCGIGSDLIAFARQSFAVRGVDRDRVTAAVAAANLAALGLSGTVTVGDAQTVDRSAAAVTFADPARRTATGRTFDPQAYAPPWSFVEEVLRGRGVVKVAPGIPHDLVPVGVEAEWVSHAGSLKEAALWSGLPEAVRVRATVLRGQVAATLTDRDPATDSRADAPGRFVYEPDDAVVRAHLVTSVCALVDGWLLDEHLAYVTADRLTLTPFARAYEVIDVLPFKEKQLKAALRTRGIGPLTIKKRGVSVTPEALRARLSLTGTTPATLLLSRTPGSAVALLVEPRS